MSYVSRQGDTKQRTVMKAGMESLCLDAPQLVTSPQDCRGALTLKASLFLKQGMFLKAKSATLNLASPQSRSKEDKVVEEGLCFSLMAVVRGRL